MTETNVKCVNYIENESCILEDGQKAFYMSTITQPLSYIIIVIFGIILCMIGLQIFSTFIFYIWFQILMIDNFITESDEINIKKLKMHEMYYYKLFNYIFCFDDKSTKEEDEKKPKKQNFYDVFNFIASTTCYDKEPYFKITLINDFYNFQFHLMMYAITATLIAAIVSGSLSALNINGYVIVGNSITSFIKEYIWIVLSFFIIAFFILLNSLVYKYYFIDSVVANIFTGYNEMLRLDKYVFDRLGETKTDLTDTVFLKLLQGLQKEDFNNETILSVISLPFVAADQSSNVRIANIILNIRGETDRNKKAAKIFMYTIYIYFHNQNAENKDILSIINNILTQDKPDNIYTFRSLLPLEIDEKNVIFDLNSIVQLLGTGIFTEKLTSTPPEGVLDGEAEYIRQEKALEYSKIQGLKTTYDDWKGKHLAYYDNTTGSIPKLNTEITNRRLDPDYITKNSDASTKKTAWNAKTAKTKCYTSSFDDKKLSTAITALQGQTEQQEITKQLGIISEELGKITAATQESKDADAAQIQSAYTAYDDAQKAFDAVENPIKELEKERDRLISQYDTNVKPNYDSSKNAWLLAAHKIELRIVNDKNTPTEDELQKDASGNPIDGEIIAKRRSAYKTRKLTLTTPEQKLTTLSEEKTKLTNSAITAREIFSFANIPTTTTLSAEYITKLKSILPNSKSDTADKITIDKKFESDLNRDDKLEILLSMSTTTNLLHEALVIDTKPTETKYTYKKLLEDLKDYKESLETAKKNEYDLEALTSCRDDINEFRTFDFITLTPEFYKVENLKQSLADRLKNFHNILMSINDIRGTLKVDKIGKDLNLVLICIWIIPSVMLLAVLYMIRTIAKDNERLRKAINFIVELILAAFDEFFWGVVF